MIIEMARLKKCIVGSLVMCGVFLPPAMHYAATGYLKTEEAVSSKVYEWKVKSLRYVGLQPVPSEKSIDEMIQAAATKYRIDPLILEAMASVESKKSPVAWSIRGAIGIMQVMPFNASRCGLPHAGRLWDEATNIECGAQIVAEERGNYKKWEDVFRVYNGGPRCVKNRCQESEQYVSRIMNGIGQRVLKG